MSSEYAGIDTFNKSQIQDINLESDLSFQVNGRLIKKNNYYMVNQRQKVAGYHSDYKVNGDTLLIYKPTTKHWYKLHAVVINRDSIEIGSFKGYDHLDTHYSFSKDH